MSVLAYMPSYNDRETFILDCDDKLLTWLSDNFENLARCGVDRHAGFVIGDRPIVSSPPTTKICMVISDADRSSVTRQQYELNWYVSRDDAIRFGAMARALQSCGFPAHQYLETDDSDAPVLMLSKGEYDARLLTEMSKN